MVGVYKFGMALFYYNWLFPPKQRLVTDVGMENADNLSVLRWWFDVTMCDRAIQGALFIKVVEGRDRGLMSGRRLRVCQSSEVFEE